MAVPLYLYSRDNFLSYSNPINTTHRFHVHVDDAITTYLPTTWLMQILKHMYALTSHEQVLVLCSTSYLVVPKLICCSRLPPSLHSPCSCHVMYVLCRRHTALVLVLSRHLVTPISFTSCHASVLSSHCTSSCPFMNVQ